MACPYLPTATEYTVEVEAAGSVNIDFEDVWERWTSIVVARAECYKGREERDANLERFTKASLTYLWEVMSAKSECLQ